MSNTLTVDETQRSSANFDTNAIAEAHQPVNATSLGSEAPPQYNNAQSEMYQVIQHYNMEREMLMAKWTEMQLLHADDKSFHSDEIQALMEVLKNTTVEKNKYKKRVEQLEQEHQDDKRNQVMASSVHHSGCVSSASLTVTCNDGDEQQWNHLYVVVTAPVLVAYESLEHAFSRTDCKPVAWVYLNRAQLELNGSCVTIHVGDESVSSETQTWTLLFQETDYAIKCLEALELPMNETLNEWICENVIELESKRVQLNLVSTKQLHILAELEVQRLGIFNGSSNQTEDVATWKKQMKEAVLQLQHDIQLERKSWELERAKLQQRILKLQSKS